MSEIASEKYQEVKSRLIRRGTNLRRWALNNGFPIGTVYNAIKGTRNGIIATRIQHRLDEFLNPKN